MKTFLFGLCRLVVKFFFRIQVEGDLTIPDGPLLLCGNHWSQWDPLLLLSVYPRDKEIPRFIAKKELSKVPIVHWTLKTLGVIFIDRGASDIHALRDILQALKKDQPIGIFPEGTRVHAIDPKNMKDGVGFLAQRSKAKILCFHIQANYRWFSKVTLSFRPLFDSQEYQAMDRKEARKEITARVYNEIYGTDFPVEDFVF